MYKYCFYAIFLLSPVSASYGTELIEVSTSPKIINESHPFELQTIYVQSRSICPEGYTQTVEVSGFNISVDLKLNTDTGPCVELDPMPTNVALTSTTINPLPSGLYTITLKDVDSSEEYTSHLFIAQAGADTTPLFNAETPMESQVVSGIGLIRGWACGVAGDTTRVEYQIDGTGPLVRLPYGSSRPDTTSVCPAISGPDTGFGGIVNWNIYDSGEHTFALFINGVEVSSSKFLVAPSKGEFLTGLEARSIIENFPSNGDTTVVEWSESDQNFKVVDVY